MLIYDKSFYPNNVYPAIDFPKIKRQLKSIYKNDLSDCGSICIIERKEYSMSINSIGEINVYYDLEYENNIQSIVDEVEKLFKSQVKNFSISKLKN
ncbi:MULTISPECIES: hypothetical protein [unclassified Clostridioides]|uniref:hypothetical protein n=1 Tax=unclassified Clostridioides TaxID=2635829 RepID=UPI001D0F52E3|nr:hypothetical protein [Clostridioides sp. ZZV15-6388]MCC0661888.1 hypothetical protein [Clostridioides sp. ZZV14-6154]MCC0662719.1 hypothetical protein [Clostridioides sp. ZZV15-6597]MCC0669685.1 hypothetical protein [Clostridioides sp. ZZV14-6153]MCC0718889.1 hypothetical protein [Clostridioides sp. ZZV14-6105]MCC0726979.1 hypothetical protein [Clostridioides sp. ZZV14-6045]MCC0731669.1 hypothetical protein [Clostridioides sp. ZZV14-6048]MCC0735917.1 hypothetical protein [Clostridioides s